MLMAINLTTNQKAVVQTSGGNMQVLINDVIDPLYSTIAANNVQSITINGGTGANLIDLRGATAAAFSRVGGVSVVVSAGTGSDTYDNDPLDTRPALEANETATTIATIFAGLPSWLDQI